MSWVSAPFTERPKKTSVPSMASVERAGLGGGGMGRLPLVHALGAALVDDALGVAQDHVLRAHTHGLEQFDTGDGGRAGAVHHQLGLAQFPAGEMAGVDQAGGGDDRGAVLVVVEDRDVHQFAQTLLDDEAFRRLDVFQVDAAEAGPEEAHGVDEFVDVLGADLEVDAVDVGEALEQRDLAFHDRLGRDRAEVAEAEHGGAVGDHGDHVALGRVVVGERRVAGDVQARFRDARRIGQREIAGGRDRLADACFQLPGPAAGVHGQCFFSGNPSSACIDRAIGHGRTSPNCLFSP